MPSTRTARVLTTVAVLVAAIVSGYTAEAAQLSAAQVTGNPGEEVSVAITLTSSSAPVSSFGMDLLFDNTKLQFQSPVARGTLTSGFTFFDGTLFMPGVVRVGGITIGSPIPTGSTGTIAVVNFVVLDCPDPSSALTLTNLTDDFTGVPTAAGSFQCEVMNQAPTADNQSGLTVHKGQSLPIALTGSDPDGDPLTYTVDTLPTLGVLTGTPPNLTYQAGNAVGPDSFTFHVNDGALDSNTATVSLTVTNTAPIADSQSGLTVHKGLSIPITLTGSDADGDALTFSVTALPTRGILSGTAPNLTYTANANDVGADSFQFHVNDGTTNSNTATVSLTVTNTNPVADSQSGLTVHKGQSIPIVLTGSDADGDALQFSVIKNPLRGVLSGTPPNLTYQAASNEQGPDSFDFEVSDGAATSPKATVSLTVTNTAPVADDQSVSTDENTAVNITLTGSDADGDAITFNVLTTPQHGLLSGTAPNLTYTPNAGYVGPDSFTFETHDGATNSAPGTVSITVNEGNVAPIASSQSVQTNEDTALPITLVATDGNGDPLTYFFPTTTVQGGNVGGSGQNVTYTPPTNFAGADSFTFQASDGTELSNVALVSITVNPVNDLPVAQNQSVGTNEDTPVPIVLVATDVDGDPLTYTVATNPAHGTLSGTPPNVSYTPATSYNGPDSFTFFANDGTGNSNTATVSIDVGGVNDAPVADSQAVNTNEDTPKPIVLTASDADGDSLTFSIVTGPAHGGLSGVPPNVTYSPNPNYNGPDSFTFKANDGQTDSNTATVSINVAPVNDPPVATDAATSTNEDTAKGVALQATDPDGDTLSFMIVTGPAHGTLNGTLPNAVYSPVLNYNGPDSFTFKANDGTADSKIATVTIDVFAVNDAPVADDQVISTNEDTSKPITLTGSDVDGDALNFGIASGPSHGTLSGVAPNLTYTPNANYHGPDSFTFWADDGVAGPVSLLGNASGGAPGEQFMSNIATVSITVNPVNDAPLAQNGAVNASEDTPANVVLQATDVDGDTLTFSIVTGPSNGLLSGVAPNLVYTPNTNFNGPDSFTFKANDGTTDSNIATVSITVAPVADGGLQIGSGSGGIGDSVCIDIDVNSAPNAASSLGFDFHFDSAALQYTGFTRGNLTTAWTIFDAALFSPGVVRVGGLTVAGGTQIPAGATGGIVTLCFTVIGCPEQASALTIDGLVDDVSGWAVEPGTFTCTDVNTAPVAQDQTVNTTEDTPVNIVLTATDADGDPLTYSVVTGPTHGSLSGVAPNLTYSPAIDYHGPDSFTFRANDGTVNSNTATVSINVAAANDAPIAEPQSLSTAEDTALNIVLAATDADSDPLTYSVVTGPTHGSLSGTAPNLTYNPTANYNGADSFTFRANDGTADSNIATISITVNPVNDAPVANAGPDANAPVGSPAALNGSGSSDVDGDMLTFAWTFLSVPFGSTLTDADITGQGTAMPSFTPDVEGPFVVSLSVSDGELDDSDTVTITAFAENVPPNANAGPDQNVQVGDTVALDGTGSFDPDSGPSTLTYAWTFSSLPAASALTDADITNANQAMAGFTPDVVGDFVLNLEVYDGEDYDSDTVTIAAAAANVPPNADAGADQTITLGDTAFLDGSGSNDPDSGPSPLSYQWNFVSVAPGSALTDADIAGATSSMPSFVPDAAGPFVVQLLVSDGEDTDIDSVVVTAEEPLTFTDVTGLLSLSTENEQSTMNRVTRVVTSTADLVISNNSDTTIHAPIHAVFVISSASVTMPDATGVNGDGHYYVDVTASQGIASLAPGETIVVPVRMQYYFNVQFTYQVQVLGSIVVPN